MSFFNWLSSIFFKLMVLKAITIQLMALLTHSQIKKFKNSKKKLSSISKSLSFTFKNLMVLKPIIMQLTTIKTLSNQQI